MRGSSPPKMTYRKVTPPSYVDTFSLERNISNTSLNSPRTSSKNDPIRRFVDSLRVAPRRIEEESSLRNQELGTIVHNDDVMSRIIVSLSRVVMTESSAEETSGASDSAIELMDEKGLLNNVHVAAKWLMKNTSPQCAYYQRRTEMRVAALCLAMFKEDDDKEGKKIVSVKKKTKKKKEEEQTLKTMKKTKNSSDNVLQQLRVISLAGLAPVCSMLLSTIRDLHHSEASKYASVFDVLRRSLNEHTARSLREIFLVSKIPSQTEELSSISNYVIRQMGLEQSICCSTNNTAPIPFQVSFDVVSHVKSDIVQRACVETLTALAVSRRSFRDLLVSIVSLVRQPSQNKFDVELSVSLNCMREMIEHFRVVQQKKQYSSSSPAPSTPKKDSSGRRVSIVQGITTTPHHHLDAPPSFSSSISHSANTYTAKTNLNYESTVSRLNAAAALMACLDRFSEPYDTKRVRVFSQEVTTTEEDVVLAPLSVDLHASVFRMLFTILLSDVSTLAFDEEDKLHAKYLILGTLRVLKVHLHQFALFNEEEGDVPQLRCIDAVRSDSELARVRNTILAIASDKSKYGDEASYEASEILRRFFPVLFYSPFHLVRFLLDSVRLMDEEKKVHSALRDVLRRELSSLRHESTWNVLWNNQTKLLLKKQKNKDDDNLDRDGCDLAYVIGMVMKLLEDTTQRNTIQMRTVKILNVVLVTAHRYLLSTLQNEIVSQSSISLHNLVSLLVLSCSDLLALVTKCFESENKIRCGCGVVIARRVLQPYLLSLASNFSLWDYNHNNNDNNVENELDFSLIRLLPYDRHDMLCRLGSSLGDILSALENVRVKTQQRQHEWLVDIEMCVGTIFSILCRDLIRGHENNDTTNIPKWLLSSSMIRFGMKEGEKDTTTTTNENVKQINDLLVPSKVLQKIWKSHSCLHVASYELVHTVWMLSNDTKFDLKLILNDPQRKKRLAKVCKQVVSKVCKSLSRMVQSMEKLSKEDQNKMYDDLSNKVTRRAQTLRNTLATSTSSSSSSVQVSEIQKHVIRFCVEDLTRQEKNESSLTLFLKKRKQSARGRILSIRIMSRLISQVSLVPLRRILLAAVSRGLEFQHYNVNMFGSGCENDISDAFFEMCVSVCESCFQNKSNYAEQILASSIVSLPLSLTSKTRADDLKRIFDLNLLKALDPLLMSHYTKQSALSRRKWTMGGENDKKNSGMNDNNDSSNKSNGMIENLLSREDNILSSWIRDNGPSNLADISMKSNLVALIRQNDGRVMSAGRNAFGCCGVGLPSSISKLTDVIGFSEGVHDAVHVCTGVNTIAVMTRQGEVLTAGCNIEGQLGQGSRERETSIPELVNFRSKVHVVTIACGSEHMVCLTSKDEVYSFGQNKHGQLGIGKIGGHARSPTRVDTLCGRSLKRGRDGLACGSDHTVALTRAGGVWVWGLDTRGQLGRGRKENHVWIFNGPVPKEICERPAPLILRDHIMKFVRCGGHNTALISSSGILFMCGDDSQSQNLAALCETNKINKTLAPRITKSVVGLKDLRLSHKTRAKWCGMLHAVPLPGPCMDARVTDEGSCFAVVRNAYDGWSPCCATDQEEEEEEDTEKIKKTRLLAWILLHAGVRPGSLVVENIEYLTKASLDNIANLQNTTSSNLQSVCSLSSKEADRLLEYVSSLKLKKQSSEEDTRTVVSELEIFAWGNKSGIISKYSESFKDLGASVAFLPHVLNRRFGFDGNPQKLVTNGTNIMLLWRNSLSENKILENVEERKTDVVDLNVFDDESKEEEKGEETFDFESTQEKIRRRAEHTSWLVLRLWSQIMGLYPRDNSTFEQVVAEWCIKTLREVTTTESGEGGEHFALLRPTLNLLYRLSSASNSVPELLRKHVSLLLSLLLRNSPKRKSLDIQVSVVRLFRHVLPLISPGEFVKAIPKQLKQISWFPSKHKDAATMWIDAIGHLQCVPMSRCRSTIRRWDMRPQSVAVRLKTGRNPMVCCSGSHEELVVASEIVALVRVLMSTSKEWESSFNVVLRQSLCSAFSMSHFQRFRGGLSVLGGYVEPLRKGCFVQITLGGGGEGEKVRRRGRVSEIASVEDKIQQQVRITLTEDVVNDSNESIWINQDCVHPLCDISVDTTRIESLNTIVSTLLDLASTEGRMIEWITNGDPIDLQVLSVIRMYASKALNEIAKSDTKCIAAGLFEESKGLRDSRQVDLSSLERDFTKRQLILRQAFMSNTRSIPEAYRLYVRLHDCSENVIRGGGVDSRRRFDMFTCDFKFFDSAQRSVQKAISSPARGSNEVRRHSVCWKDNEILTFNIYGDISDARLELSMRCVAVDKQDKSITNEVFLGSSSLKVGRYAVISLVESDEHSNFVTEGLNTIRRFSLRAPEDSDVEEVDGRNDYGTIGLSFVLVPTTADDDESSEKDMDVDEKVDTKTEKNIFPSKFSSREGPSVLTWSFDGAVSPLSTPSNTLVSYSFLDEKKVEQDIFQKIQIENKERYGMILSKGKGLLLRHGFGGGPDENDMYVNEYTILMDVKGNGEGGEQDILCTQFQDKDSIKWTQTVSTNSFDRIVMVVSVPFVKFYLNGTLVKEFKQVEKDSVFSLDSMISIVPHHITISSLQIREYALSEKQVAVLAKAQFEGLPSNVTKDTVEVLLSRLDKHLRDVVSVSDARDALRETRGNLRLANDWLRKHTTRIVSKKFNHLRLMSSMNLCTEKLIDLKTFKVEAIKMDDEEKSRARVDTSPVTVKKRKTSLEELENDRFLNLVRCMRDKYVSSSIELVLRDGKASLQEMFLNVDHLTRFLFVRALSLNVDLDSVFNVDEYVKTHCVSDVLRSLTEVSASTSSSLKITSDISWTLLWQSRVSNSSFTSYLFQAGMVKEGYKLLGDRLVTSCSIQPVLEGGIAVRASSEEDSTMLCAPKGAELVWSSHRWDFPISLYRLVPSQKGYIGVGWIVTRVGETPDISRYACVRSDLLLRGQSEPSKLMPNPDLVWPCSESSNSNLRLHSVGISQCFRGGLDGTIPCQFGWSLDPRFIDGAEYVKYTTKLIRLLIRKRKTLPVKIANALLIAISNAKSNLRMECLNLLAIVLRNTDAIRPNGPLAKPILTMHMKVIQIHDKSQDLENHPAFQALIEVVTSWYVSILRGKGNTLHESLNEEFTSLMGNKRPTSWLKDVIYDAVLVNAMTSNKESLSRDFLKNLFGPFVRGRFVNIGETFSIDQNATCHVVLSKDTTIYGDEGCLSTSLKTFTVQASKKTVLTVKQCAATAQYSDETTNMWRFSRARPTKGLELFDRDTCVEDVREKKLWRTAWIEERISVKSAWWELKIERCSNGNIMLGVGLEKALKNQNLEIKQNHHFYLGSDPLSFGWIGSGVVWDFYRGKQRSRPFGLPVISPKRPFKSGDIVRVTLQDGVVTFSVNGTKCDGIAFTLPKDAFVFPGVSLYDKGDRVCVSKVMQREHAIKKKTKRKKSIVELKDLVLTYGFDDNESEEKMEEKIRLESLPENIRDKVTTLIQMGFGMEAALESLRRNRNRIELAVNYLATHSGELEAFQESRDIEKKRQRSIQKHHREMRWVSFVASEILRGVDNKGGVFVVIADDSSSDVEEDEKKLQDINKLTRMDVWSRKDDEKLCVLVREFCRKCQKNPTDLAPYDFRVEPEALGIFSSIKTVAAAQLRFLLLRDLNVEIRRLLSLVNLSSNAPLAAQISSLRHLIFYDVKLQGFNNALRKSTRKGGSKVHLTINRLGAERELFRKRGVRRRSKPKIRFSVFDQLCEKLRDVPKSKLLVNGQAFRVTLAGEHADDSGGPFRTIFQTVSNELKSGMFDLLIPCPTQSGELYIPNPRCKDMSRFIFLGQLMGIALSSKVHLDITLGEVCWKYLCGQSCTWRDIANIDKDFKAEFENVMSKLSDDVTEDEYEDSDDDLHMMMVVKSIDGSKYALFSGGDKVRVRGKDMLRNWMKLAEKFRLNELRLQCEAIRQGLMNQLPRCSKLLPIFSSVELEEMICGESELNLDLLEKHTTYSDGYARDHVVIRRFWKVLRGFTNRERKMYLKFVYGTARLPTNLTEEKMKICKMKDSSDVFFPRAHTCFFSLDLPEYTSSKILKRRLLYAVSHTVAIDSDAGRSAETAGEMGVRFGESSRRIF